jgi:RNA polymerase sigma-70 factor (ECF subfamily)
LEDATTVEGVPEQEFARLFEATGRSLLAQAYLLTGDRQEAQDLVQEAFLRAWRDWRRVSTLTSPEAWLRRVVHNLAVGRWRRLAVRRVHGSLSLSSAALSGLSADHLDVARALHSLPPNQREALILVAFRQLSTAEAAREMRASEGTVRVWVSRARASLAVTLGFEVARVPKGGESNV